jgi:hypothetical protein
MEGSIDFYATPNVRLPPDNHFIEQDFPSFGTSYARQDVSATQEGRNQYDGLDHYNPHFASLVTIPISCLKDDEDFVSRDGQLSHGRPTYLWLVVYRFCGQNYDLAVQTWLKLLEGGTGDDIWLWVDGDEEIILMENHGLSCETWSEERIPMPTPTEWRNAASIISRRLERIRVGGSQDREESVHLAERRRRVQEADPLIRFSMISWIVASSEAMRAADASRGLNHRGRWDLKRLISTWEETVQSYWFNTATVNDVFQTFDDATKRAGHTCHDGYCSGLKEWIWMRSLLIPDQRYDVVYLSLTIESPCKACAARYLQVLMLYLIVPDDLLRTPMLVGPGRSPPPFYLLTISLHLADPSICRVWSITFIINLRITLFSYGSRGRIVVTTFATYIPNFLPAFPNG